MKSLSTAELLDIWESSIPYTPLEKSLHLLSIACNTDINSIAALSIGERDARLLAFREWIFGNRLINIVECPKCSQKIEWEMLTDDIRLQQLSPDLEPKTFYLNQDGFEIEYRLPNSFDILHIASATALRDDTAKFISGCITNIQQDKKEYTGKELPQKIIDAISRQMSDGDPQADISISLSCPDCSHQWNAAFDIVSYLWIEIDSWAKRVIKEVSVLASFFGWSESEILTLSPRRRQLYLEQVAR